MYLVGRVRLMFKTVVWYTVVMVLAMTAAAAVLITAVLTVE